MQNIPAKALVIAIIGGGFMLTGDLGWLASRGMRVLDAADVPLPAETDATATPPADAPPPPVLPAAAPVAVSPVPVSAAPAEGAPAATAIAVAGMRAPAGGREPVAWATLRAGDRVVVWLAGQGPRCLVLDVVDSAAGEALAYEAATVSTDGLPLAAAGPPGRVVVGRLSEGQVAAIVPGGMLHLAPAGIAAAGGSGHWFGPVEAIRVVR